jgi:L-glutamine-phosphate cytidylyltransferase
MTSWSGQAVILAAGIGSRLGPLTTHIPKCLVRVGGMTILERALRAIKSAGAEEAVIVTGYKREVLEAFASELETGLKLSFVHNPDYATTNNVYSLWMAHLAIESDFLLVESDVLFTPSMIADLSMPCTASLSPFRDWMNGTVASVDSEMRVNGMYLKNDVKPEVPLFKTVNLYSFDFQTWKCALWPRLDHKVRSGEVQVYYEAVIAEAIREDGLHLRAAICPESKWLEVDTPEDLDAARKLFKL